MKKYEYQLIRYIHNHFTGEFVNVGVVVYSRDEKFLSCRVVQKYQRITHMFPDAKGSWILRILNNYEFRLKSISQEFTELFQPSETLDQITKSILVDDDNCLRFTEVKSAVDIDLSLALEDLYNSLVTQYVLDKSDKGSLLDDDIWRMKYKKYFEQYNIDKRLKSHTVSVPNDVFLFGKAWKNEIWHCYEPLSFVLKEKDSIKDKVYKWAGKLQGLQQSNEAIHLTLLTSISEKHRDLSEFIEKYLKIENGNLKVDLVTEEMAENLAREISAKMEQHDSQ